MPPAIPHALPEVFRELIDRNDQVALNRPLFKKFRLVTFRIVEIRVELLIANFLILDIFAALRRQRNDQLVSIVE